MISKSLPHLLLLCFSYLCLSSVNADSSNSISSSSSGGTGGIIQGRLQFPDQSPFNLSGTKVVLNHGEQTTYARSDGQFALTNVQPGIHVVDVHSNAYHFSQLKIQLLADDLDHPKVLEYYYPGATKHSATLPIAWTALATYDYFEPRGRFSMFGMLKNPMVIMMVLSIGMMAFMPKMMDQLEPEEKERMKKQMAMQSDPQQMLGQLWGDLTGSTNTDSSAGGATSSPKKKAAIKK